MSSDSTPPEELEALCAWLDDHADSYKWPTQIGDLFKPIRDREHDEGNASVSEKAQWEIEFFNLVLSDGKVGPSLSGTTGDGEPFQFPDVKLFSDETYEYLAERLDQARNPVLRARYAQILWNGPKKHSKFGQASVEANLEALIIHEQMLKNKGEIHTALELIASIKNAWAVSRNTKYKTDAVRAEIVRLASSLSESTQSSVRIWHDLVQHMLKEKNTFSAEDFDGIADSCWNRSERIATEDNLHAAIEYLELGTRIDRQTRTTTHRWNRRKAEHYEKLADTASATGNLAAVTFYSLAIEAYKADGNSERAEELLKKHSTVKVSIPLNEIKTEIDLGPHFQTCKEIASDVVERGGDVLLRVLAADPFTIPSRQLVEKHARETASRAVMLQLIPISPIDDRGNTIGHYVTPEEKERYNFFQTYQLEVQLDKSVLIDTLIETGLKAGVLTKDSVEKFLRNGWQGQELQRQLPSNQQISYRWIDLLAPSLGQYIEQMQDALNDPATTPQLVLCIDSLTLKFEGMLRDICRLSNCPTAVQTREANGLVDSEIGLRSLLAQPPITKLLSDDELVFLEYLLIEKLGRCMRHNVAHSRLEVTHYSPGIMNLLFVALLRLRKFTLS